MRTLILAAGMLVLAACATPSSVEGETAGPAATLNAYQCAIVARDLAGTEALFTADAIIVEQGNNEGDYETYREHHLGPELGEVRDFRFDGYAVDIEVAGNQARALETYTYHIVLSDRRAVDRQGAATSVLMRGADGRWRIAQYHSSSRAITPPA
jgi:uncharacterized protein (TIGR02246 family)